MGRDKESEQSLRQVLELQRRVLGPEQPETAVTVYNLGVWPQRVAGPMRRFLFCGVRRPRTLPLFAVRMGEDPDLNSLHGDPRFAALVALPRSALLRKKKIRTDLICPSSRRLLFTRFLIPRDCLLDIH